MKKPKTQDSNYQQHRAALLVIAASKPIMEVHQWDGYQDNVIWPDEDGDEIWHQECDELRRRNCVRVQIPKTFPLTDAARILRKLLACVERDAGIKSETPTAPYATEDLATVSLKAALARAKGTTF